MVVPGWTAPEGSMLVTVPGVASLTTSTPVTCSPLPISSLRTSLYGRPRYASGIRLIAAGVDSVGVAELGVGVGVSVGEADDADGVALLGFAMLDVALLAAGPCEGKRLPAWLRTTPTRAKTTSRISAISGHVHGLRPRRFGSSSGSS